MLSPARPRAARRPGVVRTDPMGHLDEKSRPGSVFPDNSLNWVRSRRSLLKHALGVGHALVLSHGAAPRPTRPGMIHSMPIVKPPGRIRHGNGRGWKYWWPMWPLSPTGLWWPNMLYWASVSILGRRNPGIFFQVLRQHDPWWFARTLNGLKRVPIARERGWLNPLESGSKKQGARS